MKKVFKISGMVIFLAVVVAGALAPFMGDNGVSPRTNAGRKWRVGYYEGGPWVDYQDILASIVRSFMDMGWVRPAVLPQPSRDSDSSVLWRWLSEGIRSEYIDFVDNAYWSSGWDDDTRERNRNAAIERLAKRRDLDLVIAAGTWAGQDLANNMHSVPVIVISASDPVRAGIVKSARDSGFDHVFAKVDPERYIRQLRLFHNLVGFKRLGLVYENTAVGRSYAALDDVSAVAREKGFQVVVCTTLFSNSELEDTESGVIGCVEELAPRIDAFYLTTHRGQTTENIDQILKPLLKWKIPTWAQPGSEFVERGVLLSTTKGENSKYGRFYAQVLAEFFNGRKLRELDQVFEDPTKLAVNMKTAEAIGYEVPPAILGTADIYPKQ